MATHHLEVERKYELVNPDQQQVSIDWSSLANLTADQPLEENMSASYFDTQENDLGRNLVALRRRVGGYDQGWHIKFDDRAGARHEIHYDLLKDEKKMPASVSQFVRSVTLGDALKEIVSIDTHRVRTVLRDSAGTAVAEICDDTVEALEFATHVRRAWHEWEIELLEAGEGSPAEIFAACERLLFAAGVEPSQSSAKIARALGRDEEFEARRQGISLKTVQKKQKKALKTQKNNRTGASSNSLELMQNILHMLTSNLMLWELKMRAETPDTVHGMRIGTRQLGAVLRFAVRPYAKNEQAAQEIDRLLVQLKSLMKGLSSARDIDIVTEFLGGVDAQNAPITESARKEFDEYLASDDEDANRAVRRLIDSHEYLKLRVELVELTEHLEAVVDLPLNAENFVNKVAKRMRKQLVGFSKNENGKVWEGGSSDFAYDVQNNDLLFNIRRDAQSVRYCLEAFDIAGVILTKDHKKLRNIAGELHRDLSVLSDEQVILDWLESASRRAQRGGNDRLAVGYLWGRSSYYAVGLRMSAHHRVPLQLKKMKKLELK